MIFQVKQKLEQHRTRIYSFLGFVSCYFIKYFILSIIIEFQGIIYIRYELAFSAENARSCDYLRSLEMCYDLDKCFMVVEKCSKLMKCYFEREFINDLRKKKFLERREE